MTTGKICLFQTESRCSHKVLPVRSRRQDKRFTRIQHPFHTWGPKDLHKTGSRVSPQYVHTCSTYPQNVCVSCVYKSHRSSGWFEWVWAYTSSSTLQLIQSFCHHVNITRLVLVCHQHVHSLLCSLLRRLSCCIHTWDWSKNEGAGRIKNKEQYNLCSQKKHFWRELW